MVGFDVSERTVSRWIKRFPMTPDPTRRWLAFVRNHREAIAAMDFFTIPTAAFRVVYCFVVIGHDRLRILHFNVTSHPTVSWISNNRGIHSHSGRHPISDLRPECEVRVGSVDSRSIPQHRSRQDFLEKPMAERRCGALD